MEDFTFIVVTYNHEKYITEHLESIKQIIQNYREDLLIDILICDDASNDKTVEIASAWLDKNETLFRNKKIINRKKNIGTVANLFDAVNNCKTDNFKILAGDDKYVDANIFEVQKNINANEVIITPLIPFAETKNDHIRNKTEMINKYFQMIFRNQNKLKKLEKINNYIPAPGAFYGKNVLRDKELQKFVSRYRLIEDMPIWHFILFKSNCYRIRIIDSPKCVCYRLNSGVSTHKRNTKPSEYDIELNKLKRELDLLFFKYPKWINPYCYEVHLIRIMGNLRNKIGTNHRRRLCK